MHEIDPGTMQRGEFTLHDVSAAISRQLHLPPELNEVAGLAGKLHGFVNASAAFRRSGLDGAGFKALLMSNLTAEVERLIDPAQLARIRAEQAAKAHPASSQPAAAGLLGIGGRPTSSAGYAKDLAGSGDATAREALVSQAREMAIKSGLGWATNNPDLLALGPSAIKALADVHFRQDSYEALRRAGYSANDQVGLARYAKKKHLDANKLAHELSESNISAATKPDGSIDRPMLDQLRKIQTGLMAKPDDAAEQKKYDASMEEMKKAHPDKVEPLSRSQKALGRAVKESNAAVKTADVKVADAAVRVANADVKVAARDTDRAVADTKEAKVDDTAAKMAEMLKKRREAAATGPKAAH